MTSARDAGLAVIANLASCNHPRVEPVELLLTGETVAAICAGCLLELPVARLGNDANLWCDYCGRCDHPTTLHRGGF